MPEIRNKENACDLPQIRGRVDFNDVVFRYEEGGRNILNLVDFHVEPGRTIALVGPTDPKMLLAKDSFVSGLLGVLYLASLAAPKPIMFYFGRKFATDGTPEMISWWNSMWQYEGFRKVQRNLTLVWGVAFVLEAALRIVFVYTLSHGTVVTINNILPYVVIGGLVYWTMTYAKRASARGRAAAEAAAAAAA